MLATWVVEFTWVGPHHQLNRTWEDVVALTAEDAGDRLIQDMDDRGVSVWEILSVRQEAEAL